MKRQETLKRHLLPSPQDLSREGACPAPKLGTGFLRLNSMAQLFEELSQIRGPIK